MSPFENVLRDLQYATLDRLRLAVAAEQERRGARFDAGDAPTPTDVDDLEDARLRVWTQRASQLRADLERVSRERDDAREESKRNAYLARRGASHVIAADRECEKLRDVVRACRDEADRGLGPYDGSIGARQWPASDHMLDALARILAACRAAVST